MAPRQPQRPAPAPQEGTGSGTTPSLPSRFLSEPAWHLHGDGTRDHGFPRRPASGSKLPARVPGCSSRIWGSSGGLHWATWWEAWFSGGRSSWRHTQILKGALKGAGRTLRMWETCGWGRPHSVSPAAFLSHGGNGALKQCAGTALYSSS